MRVSTGFGLIVAISATIIAMPATATVFTGFDIGALPNGPRPKSNAADTAFKAAAGVGGTVNTITFEGLRTGKAASYALAPGVTAKQVNADRTDSVSGIQTYDGDPDAGWNTTVGGRQFLRFSATDSRSVTTASTTFSFASPIDAFGTYITGLGTADGSFTLNYNDGTANTISIVGSDRGGSLFYGFTDPGKDISSITFSLSLRGGFITDVVGFDDVQYVFTPPPPPPSAVPEPASWAMMVAGFGLLGGTMRRRVRSTAHA